MTSMQRWTTKQCPCSKDVEGAGAAGYASAALGTVLSGQTFEADATTHRVERGVCERRLDLGISIKSALRKLEADPAEIAAAVEPAGFIHLPLSSAHAAKVVDLPPVHKDPFDRLLVAQARVEPMILLTG